jgi:hypothetical protein
MATIKRSLLGKVSGSAGDFVFYTRNGKRHFRAKPKPRDPDMPKSQKTIDNENGFAYTSSFTKEISKNDLLKVIWKHSDIPAENYYSRIFSANRKRTEPSGLTLHNIITPDNIFLETGSVVLDDDYFSIGYKIKSENQNVLQPPFFAVSVLFLCNPHKPAKENNFVFLPFEKLVTEQFIDKPDIVTFSFNETDKSVLSEFKNGIVYLTFISKEIIDKPYEWTTTAAVEINLAL